MFDYIPEIAEVMPTVSLLNRPQLTASLVSMTENQLRLYHSLKMSHRLNICAAESDPQGNKREIFVIADELGNALFAYENENNGFDALPGAIRQDFRRVEKRGLTLISVREFLMLRKLPSPNYLPEFF